jgi:hypothetical protein
MNTPEKFPVSPHKAFRIEPRWPCQTEGNNWAEDAETDATRKNKAAMTRHIFFPPAGGDV